MATNRGNTIVKCVSSGARLAPLSVFALFLSCSQADIASRRDPCLPKPTDLVSFFPGDGHTFDVIGRHEGLFTGTAQFEPGVVAQAFRFDGFGSLVTISYSSKLDFVSSFSIVCWVKLNVPLAHQPAYGLYNEYPFIVEKGDGGYTRRNYGLYFSQQKNSLNFDGFGQSTQTHAFSTSLEQANKYFDDLRWHLVSATWDRSRLTANIYIDGKSVTSAQGADNNLLTNSDPLKIGAAGFDKYFLAGSVDELALFSRSLSQSEILAIYRAGSNGLCK